MNADEKEIPNALLGLCPRAAGPSAQTFLLPAHCAHMQNNNMDNFLLTHSQLDV